jgi:hypothetical protein
MRRACTATQCAPCNLSIVVTPDEQLPLHTSWQPCPSQRSAWTRYCYCTALILPRVCFTLQLCLTILLHCDLSSRSSDRLVSVGSDTLLVSDTTKCILVCCWSLQACGECDKWEESLAMMASMRKAKITITYQVQAMQYSLHLQQPRTSLLSRLSTGCCCTA